MSVPGYPDNQTEAFAINDKGQIVGYLNNQHVGYLHFGGTDYPITIPVANQYTTAVGINDKGQIVGNFGDPRGGFHGYVLTPMGPPPLTLAKLSQDVYNNLGGSTIDGFVPIPSLSRTGIGGYAANVYQNCSEVVIAIRGTDLSHLFPNGALNLISDKSWIAGASGFAFLTLQTDVDALVKQLEDVYGYLTRTGQNFEITLTGHSLGGAIAQAVGQAAGVAVTSFDAPGPGNSMSKLTTDLNPITVFNIPSPSNQITNYRLYGDQVSFAGKQLGTTITVENSLSNSVVDSNLLPTTWLTWHQPSNLINRLGAGATQIDGAAGVNITDPLLRLITLLRNPNDATAPEIMSILVELASTPYWIDPDPGSGYLLQATSTSPCIQSVDLPIFGDIERWSLKYHSGSSWSVPAVVGSEGEITFDQCVDGLDFIPLDLAGDAIFNSDAFIFGLAFSSTGDFEGTLTTSGASAVPNRAHSLCSCCSSPEHCCWHAFDGET